MIDPETMRELQDWAENREPHEQMEKLHEWQRNQHRAGGWAHSESVQQWQSPRKRDAAALKADKDMQQSARSTQHGGAHYKDLPIQPVEYIHQNGIGFCEGCAIKYLTRWRSKGGIEDLRKARHFIELLIEMEMEP